MSSRPSSSVGTFLFGSLLGLGIGSLLALLLTPTSGAGIRTWVQKKMSQCPCWKTDEPNIATKPTASEEETLADDPYEFEVGY
jgi:gas vesicle protein